MKNKYSILILAVAVAVKLSNGYSIKEPAFSASFSGSSASSSAFSHSSSSSYTFNGDLKPHDVEGLKGALQAGAVASASAGAIAGSGAGAGAVAGANAGAIAGAGKGTGAVAGANAGAIAGAGAGNGALSGAEAVAGANAQAGSGSLVGSVPTAGENGAYSSGANAASGAEIGTSGSSGCSGGGACGSAGQDSNAIAESSGGADTGAYKGIGSDKYTTGYSNGAKTNYVISGNYVQGSPSSVGGCVSCKGPFPGPNGSIHDYKPASSVPAVPHAGSVQPASSGGSSVAYGTINGPASHQQPLIHNLPGASGGIYSSKPSTGFASPSSTNYATGSGSGHVSPGLISTLPGPSGSIHTSKPVNAGAIAGATASAGSGSYSNTGSQFNVIPSQPTTTPSCSYSPGSPNKNCGGASHAVFPKVPVASGPGLSGIIATLPGPSGSIHDSKPASSVPLIHGAGSTAGSGASSGAYNGAGSVTNIPVSHPVVGPACSYSPGSPNKCGSASGAGANANAGAQAAAGAISGSSSGSGSVTNIPASHPIVGPVCSYSPGSPNKCGSNSAAEAAANANAAAQAGAGGCVSCKGPFPGPSGSIYDYKPASSISTGGFHNGGGAHTLSGLSSSSFNGPLPGSSGSTYQYKPTPSVLPGVHNGGGANLATGSGGSLSSSSALSGSAGLAPSIHPETPSSGTYYVNKPGQPAVDFQPPLVSSSPSFSGQIPCADSSCGSIQKSPAAAPSLPQTGNCGSGSGCGGDAGSASGSYSGSQGSAGSGIFYVDKDVSGQYQGLNHDSAHLSGGIVYENEDGSYHNTPVTTKPIYKNAEKGGYAVSSNSADNTGFLIGPGTGHLPIESDADSKPFGTQGAFGGSAAFAKGAAVKDNKPFGTQGAFGGSAAFSKSSANAQSSETQANSGSSNGFANGDVTIEKSDGIIVAPVSSDFGKPACSSGICGSGGNSFTSNGAASEGTFVNGQGAAGSPVKLQCSGSSCGDTEVYVIEEKPSKPGSYGSGSYSGSGSESGSAASSGFATGQVLVNQGGNTYDVTNSGSNALGGSYSGAQSGAYSGNSQFGSSGCSTGQCGGHGFSAGGSFAIPSPGGFLDKLFGAGGLSGTALNRFVGGAHGGSAAYSNAGSYAGANAGSFASAGASAHAHAGSFASSY